MNSVARRRGVEQVRCRPDHFRLGDRAADGTYSRGAAMTRHSPVGGPVFLGRGLPMSHPQTDLMASRAAVYSTPPPTPCGAERLVHLHSYLLQRPTFEQRGDNNVRIVRYFVQPEDLWDWAFISIRGTG